MHALLRKLDGGDLRSIGRSNEVAREVISNPRLAGELVSGLSCAKPIVRMRCADALEKVCRVLPHATQPHREELLRLLRSHQPKEVLWHLLQITPRVEWSREDLPVVYEAVTRATSESSSIVRVCAMQALVELLPELPKRRPQALRLLRELTVSGTPAMRARGKKLLRFVEVAGTSIQRNFAGRRAASAPRVKR